MDGRVNARPIIRSYHVANANLFAAFDRSVTNGLLHRPYESFSPARRPTTTPIGKPIANEPLKRPFFHTCTLARFLHGGKYHFRRVDRT